MYIINGFGDILCYDLGEPIHAFHFGCYAFELNTLSNVFDPSLSSFDIDSYQTNTGFELAMDSPPNTSPNDNQTYAVNKLHAIFISSITNKLCLTQIDQLISNAKSTNNNQIKYKCDNVFTKKDYLTQNLSKYFQTSDTQSINKAAKYLLYYQNTINADDSVDEDENQVR